jgi:hypothetical protein
VEEATALADVAVVEVVVAGAAGAAEMARGLVEMERVVGLVEMERVVGLVEMERVVGLVEMDLVVGLVERGLGERGLGERGLGEMDSVVGLVEMDSVVGLVEMEAVVVGLEKVYQKGCQDSGKGIRDKKQQQFANRRVAVTLLQRRKFVVVYEFRFHRLVRCALPHQHWVQNQLSVLCLVLTASNLWQI